MKRLEGCELCCNTEEALGTSLLILKPGESVVAITLHDLADF